MVFSSPTFLFFFLPAVLAAYLCVGQRARNLLLLVASMLFYFWGEQLYVLVLVASALFNYCFGLLVARQDRTGKLALILAAAVNLGLLGFFKYAGFAVANLNVVLAWLHLAPVAMKPVHLPIGISFFTFEALSYLVDVRQRKCQAQRNPLHVGMYFSLFPRLIAGPIVRYSDIASQIDDRRLRLDDFVCGIERFVFGLGKKTLIANPAGLMADLVFGQPASQLSSAAAWLGVLCYSLQIYFDFSGYSDMAIGLGRMFGFRILENFDHPYVSRSIREFWRRWHISLSTWFRDYLYIPLGGSRRSTARTSANLLLVFLLCGLWHGASWNFVLWGLLHGVLLVLERGPMGRLLERLHPLCQHGYALLAVGIGWVLFRIERLADAMDYLAVMHGLAGADSMMPQIAMRLDAGLLLPLAAGLLLSAPLPAWLRRHWSDPPLGLAAQTARLLLLAAVLLQSAASLAVNSYNPFIYFRF